MGQGVFYKVSNRKKKENIISYIIIIVLYHHQPQRGGGRGRENDLNAKHLKAKNALNICTKGKQGESERKREEKKRGYTKKNALKSSNSMRVACAG